jgi:hypothetical protein
MGMHLMVGMQPGIPGKDRIGDSLVLSNNKITRRRRYNLSVGTPSSFWPS